MGRTGQVLLAYIDMLTPLQLLSEREFLSPHKRCARKVTPPNAPVFPIPLGHTGQQSASAYGMPIGKLFPYDRKHMS